MDLWIRSQDKMALELVKHIEIKHNQEFKKCGGMVCGTVDIEECYILVNGKNFGEYKTEQRAIEVLDEIQNKLMGASKIILQPHQNLSMLSYKDFEKVSNRAKEELRQDIGVLSNLFDYSVVNQETVVYEMPADDEAK